MSRRFVLPGLWKAALDKIVLRPAHVRLLRVLGLESSDLRPRPAASDVDVRWLSVEEVARFAANPANQIGSEFVERARGGMDLCVGALCDDRLAAYAWCALGSVEGEHAAGVDLELPNDTAYLYKGFTHPDFRGRRLYPASMIAALSALRRRGVERLVAFVHWHNASALRSCEQTGYRDLGRMIVGPRGPLSVPAGLRDLGVRFGAEATVVPRH